MKSIFLCFSIFRMATFNDSNAKQLQELVTCAICLDYYQDPRLLPCSHTFCFQCIEKLVKNGSFNCPLQDNMKITQNDITQLPINRTAKDMVEFVSSINLSTDKKSTHQCDNCNENEGINWCDKCAFHYCESCTKSVHSIKSITISYYYSISGKSTIILYGSSR